MTTLTDSTTLITDRDRAISWARCILADPRARILALDTTGVHLSAEPVAIAVTDTAGVVIFNVLVLPDGEVDPEAAALHGLTRRVLERAGAPLFAEVYEHIADIVWDHTIVTFHETFVSRVLDLSCMLHDLDVLPLLSTDDAMEQYALSVGERIATGRYRSQRLPRSEESGWRGPVRTCRDIAALLRVMAAGQET